MKMDKLAGSGNDEFYTPKYAVKPHRVYNGSKMREYYFILKDVKRYFRFPAKNNNDAIKQLVDLGVSYSCGILCELEHSHPRNKEYILEAVEISSLDVVEYTNKNVELGHSNKLANSSLAFNYW